MDNPRRLALASLVKTDTQECYSNIEVNTTLSRAKMEKNDSALYTLLYMGALENKILLDHIISQYSTTPLDKIDVEALNILRLGIYQLLFTDKIPDYSAVNESVEMSPKRTKGFVNAVLRSFIRNNKDYSLPKDKWERLSVEKSIPLDIVNLLRRSYGDKDAYELCTYNGERGSVSLRVNTLMVDRERLLAALEKRGVEFCPSKYTEDIIKCYAPVSEIKDIIDTGLAFVQDESSCICTKIINAQKGDTVADVCACPGGKSFSMAIDMENDGKIFSSDLHKNKLSLITKGADRLAIDIISVREQNAKNYVKEYDSAFDKVLCDVPCSGLGVIFKKPDIKYKSIEGINGLPNVQYDILANCSRYVKKGGYLIYSTCTINTLENEENVKRFLSDNQGFVLEDFQIGDIKSKDGMYTFLPHITDTDGFFVAKMKRVN